MVAALTAVRDLGRLREIALVLAKHGFGEVLGRMGLGGLAPKTTRPDAETSRRAAWPERIRLVLEDLGPSFMKLGQIASTRPERQCTSTASQPERSSIRSLIAG